MAEPELRQFSEEDVKVKIVLPWLNRCGVRLEDLQLETSFSVPFGRQTVGVKGGALWRSRARLDILVKRRGVSLLVVEVKADGLELSDADREQAISYAKLVHPIAPFAVVTNGREFRIYDTLTKKLVDPVQTRIDGRFEIVIPNEARLEALRLFLAPSSGNLRVLSREQVQKAIQPLLGTVNDLGAVYIEAAHLPRTALTTLTAQFLKSGSPGLVIVGESGMGKTCAAIDIAKHLVQQGFPAFFFRGIDLDGSLQDAVAREVEWAFGGDREGTIAALARLTDSPSRPLVVVVDALEDWNYETKFQEVGFLLSHSVGRPVRLILTCKSRSWSQFVERRGSRTGIETHIFGADASQPYSTELEPFDSPDFFRVLERYRTAFRVDARIDRPALAEARRNPFVLRLLFQVASQGAADFITLDSRPFFEQYLDLITRKTERQSVAVDTLVTIARLMADANQDWVSEETIRRVLFLGATEIQQELFDQKILTGSGVPGTRRIGFSFGQLRNYLVAFHARQWPTTAPDDLAAEIHARPEGVVAEAAHLYYPSATPTQQAALDGPLRTNASKYLTSYVSVIETHFPKLKGRFTPRTVGRIGFVGEFLVSEQRLGFCGFRPISGTDPDVLFVPVDPLSFRDRKAVSRVFRYGVTETHYRSSTNGFRSLDVTRNVLLDDVLPQLEKLIRKGRLNEEGLLGVTEDVVVGMHRKHSDLFGNRPGHKATPPGYPIDVRKMLEAVRRSELRHHFESELTERRRASGLIKERWNGDIVSYSPHLSNQDRIDIETKIEESLSADVPVRLSVRVPALEELRFRLVELLAERGPDHQVIDAPTLPALPERLRFESVDPHTHELIAEHVRMKFALALVEYRRIVETNFPTLRQPFRLYSDGPVDVVIVPQWAEKLYECGVATYWLPWKGEHDRVTLGSEDQIDRSGHRLPRVRTPSGLVESESVWTVGLDSLLFRSPFLELDYEGAAGVRNLVYEWLWDDCQRLQQALLNCYGLAAN